MQLKFYEEKIAGYFYRQMIFNREKHHLKCARTLRINVSVFFFRDNARVYLISPFGIVCNFIQVKDATFPIIFHFVGGGGGSFDSSHTSLFLEFLSLSIHKLSSFCESSTKAFYAIGRD